jgi:hypothetical protein
MIFDRSSHVIHEITRPNHLTFERNTTRSHLGPYLAIDIVAAVIVVDPVPVAHVEPVLGAVPPDRVLHEPRESSRELRVEQASLHKSAAKTMRGAQD